MENTIEKLYQYLKGKYGIEGTENFNIEENISKGFKFEIPGVRKNNKDHSWTAFVENGAREEISLIIGEDCPSGNTSWARYFEIIDYNHEQSPIPFFKLIRTMPFDEDLDFKTLTVFLHVFEEFFEVSKTKENQA